MAPEMIPIMEDTHAGLIASLVANPSYDIIQLDPVHDPDVIGLVVDGELRVTYRKVTEYTTGSNVAREILGRIRRQAVAANTLVRGYGRVVGNAPAPKPKGSAEPVHGNVASDPADLQWEGIIPDPTTWEDISVPDFAAPKEVLGIKDFEPLEEMREGYRPTDLHIRIGEE